MSDRIRDGIECGAERDGLSGYRARLTLRYDGRTMHFAVLKTSHRSRGDAVRHAQRAASYLVRSAFDIGQTIYDLAPSCFAQWAERA